MWQAKRTYVTKGNVEAFLISRNFGLICACVCQVHGLWKDKANRDEGDDTDEAPTSPFSPPGIN